MTNNNPPPVVFFRRGGAQILPLPAAAGPWMPNALSGSAVGPLFASLLEDVTPPQPMRVTRLSIEFLRPVPLAPLDYDVRIVREGRKQQILQLTLLASGKPVAQATALRLRCLPAREVANVETGDGQPFEPPAGTAFAPGIRADNGMLQWLESRVQSATNAGAPLSDGWFRFLGRIFDDRPLTPLTRAALFADFGNGFAPIFDARQYSYLNADLTLHLARLPVGEWLRLQAQTVDGTGGLAMTVVTMSDAQGTVGWSHQSLLIEPRSVQKASTSA